jgi:hypothetical protein
MLDRADVLWNTPWPQPTEAGLMVLVKWILALAIVIGAAVFLPKWFGRKWLGQVLPAENVIDS